MDKTIIYGGDHRQLWGFILLSTELAVKSELGMRGPGVGACCLNIYSSHQVFCSTLAFQCPSWWPFTVYQYPCGTLSQNRINTSLCFMSVQTNNLLTAISSSLSHPKNHMTWCSNITYFMQSHLGFQSSMTISNTHLYLRHAPLDS